MVRENRIKEYSFTIGSLTSAANGLFNVYSERPLNGTIQNIEWNAGNHTSTGSILIFASGLNNSGTALGGQILNVSGISVDGTYYPYVTQTSSIGILGSFTNVVANGQPVINSTIRVVGSAVGNAKSGLGLNIRYI